MCIVTIHCVSFLELSFTSRIVSLRTSKNWPISQLESLFVYMGEILG